ncbi:hypothetical protein Barb7_01741 [Bacteroidales bacterium Barb7]|nr:hypothetical protein Barb7_01741 [Bacteroidales bacterium Barb7]
MDTLRPIRLINHRLSGATKRQTPGDIVAQMGAMQAQDYTMAKWGVGIRLPGSTNREVEDAFNRGDILRTHVLRPTWHFVSPANIRWMLSLSARRIQSSARSRDRELEITEELYSKTNRLLQKALEGNKHLTREALERELEQAGIKGGSSRMVHFMMRAETEGIVCSGALQGKSHTYALLEERVPQAAPLHKEEALAKLVRLYFTSHGPAALPDFVWWSGLSQTEARIGLEAVSSDLVTERINGQTYYHATAGNIPDAARSACLLPAFDEYIISYKDRQAVLSSEHHAKAVSSNGIFRPTIIVNGQVAGLWKKAVSKNAPVLLNFFEQPDASAEESVHKAVDAFMAFQG